MKKVLVMVALVMVSVIVYAFNDRAEAKQGKKEVTGNNGEAVSYTHLTLPTICSV